MLSDVMFLHWISPTLLRLCNADLSTPAGRAFVTIPFISRMHTLLLHLSVASMRGLLQVKLFRK